MENENTKIWQILLAIIVIGIIAWILIKSPESSVVPETSDTTNVTPNPLPDSNVEVRQLCYIWNTEAGDKAELSMDIRNGTDVTGEFNWLPAEKDKKTGTFIGTAGPVDPYSMSRTLNGIWQVSAEGMTNSEEIIIKFGEGVAGVGTGEMKDKVDGTYVYAYPENLSFEPNLQQTDCGDDSIN